MLPFNEQVRFDQQFIEFIGAHLEKLESIQKVTLNVSW